MKALLAAIRFLTILPLPGSWGTTEADLARSVPYFPLVGLLLGGVAGTAAWMLVPYAPPMVVAAALVVLLLAVSGCLHLDGLSDTADGFLSSRRRERVLEIMKDSHVGAMGVIAIVCLLLVKFAAIGSLAAGRPSMLWPAVALMPIAGRAAIVVNMACLPYSREAGLGKVFYQKTVWPWAVCAMVVLGIAGWLMLGNLGLGICVVSLAASLLLAGYVYRKIGGATGDTLGAACELVETIPVLVTAIWTFEAAR